MFYKNNLQPMEANCNTIGKPQYIKQLSVIKLF